MGGAFARANVKEKNVKISCSRNGKEEEITK
jgi:hypothetical protein